MLKPSDRDMQRFWERVNKTLSCWEWTGSLARGYGRFYCGGAMHLAHRFAYLTLKGAIPDGLCLDHLCHNRCCVNPDHLQPVTQWVNSLRGDHPNIVAYRENVCPQGHSMDDAYTSPKDGRRQCRTCRKHRKSQWHQRNKVQERWPKNHEIVKMLSDELREVLSWALVEQAPLREQEIESIRVVLRKCGMRVEPK